MGNKVVKNCCNLESENKLDITDGGVKRRISAKLPQSQIDQRDQIRNVVKKESKLRAKTERDTEKGFIDFIL